MITEISLHFKSVISELIENLLATATTRSLAVQISLTLQRCQQPVKVTLKIRDILKPDNQIIDILTLYVQLLQLEVCGIVQPHVVAPYLSIQSTVDED